MSLGIYVSFPFSKHSAKDLERGTTLYRKGIADDYLTSLVQEIEESSLSEKNVSSLLLGGGDWSCVGPELFTRLILLLRRKFNLTSTTEFSLEVSVTGISPAAVRNFCRSEVNRLSLNLFRFHPGRLKRAGSILKKGGIKNFNFDLYFGQPGQTLSSWKRDLHRMVELDPTHLSLYTCGSAGRRMGLEKELYLFALDFLARQGYRQYEICHFCRPGFESKQNLLYWRRKNFLGFGAGAASLRNEIRWQNPKEIRAYIKFIRSGKKGSACGRKLTREEQIAEVIYYRLRQTRGLELTVLQDNFDCDLHHSKEQLILALIAKGYLSLQGKRLSLTKEAYLIADDLITKLI